MADYRYVEGFERQMFKAMEDRFGRFKEEFVDKCVAEFRDKMKEEAARTGIIFSKSYSDINQRDEVTITLREAK